MPRSTKDFVLGCIALPLCALAPLTIAAPVAMQDIRQVSQGATVIIDVLSNDSGDGALEIVSFSQPQSGVVSKSGGGGLRLALANDFFGELTFTYTLQDDSGELSQGGVSVSVVRSATDSQIVQGTVAAGALTATQTQFLQSHSTAVSQWLKVSQAGTKGASAGDGLIPLGGLFASIHGLTLESNMQTGADSQTTDIQGLTLGADWNLGEQWLVGAALGMNKADTPMAEAEQTLDETSLLLFGQYRYGQWLAEGQLGFSQSDIEQSGTNEFTTEGASQFALLKAEYRFTGSAWQIMPGLSLAHDVSQVDGFTQQLGARQVAYGEFDNRHLRAVASFYGDYAFSTSWGVLLPQLTLSSHYCVDSSSDDQNMWVNGQPFSVQNTEEAHFITLDAGVAFWLTHGLSGFVNYHRMERHQSQDLQGANLGVRWEF